MIFDMWDDGPAGKFLVVLLGCAIAIIPVAIYAYEQEQKAWEAFKTAHSCRIVSKTSGTTGTGFGTTIGSNGQIGVGPVVVSNPGQTGWLCNDGVTYWR